MRWGGSWRLHVADQVAKETRDQKSGHHHDEIDLHSLRDEDVKILGRHVCF
jgi:hypothetical protein